MEQDNYWKWLGRGIKEVLRIKNWVTDPRVEMMLSVVIFTGIGFIAAFATSLDEWLIIFPGIIFLLFLTHGLYRIEKIEQAEKSKQKGIK